MKINDTAKKILTLALIGLGFHFQARAQLAFTEVMTSESSTVGGASGAPKHPDWWELSNFGTNAIDLTGYSWNDDAHGGLAGADTTPFTGVIIHPGEAIIFTEPSAAINSADDFRQWWGTNNIGTNVQIILLGSADPGLSASGDSVRLWSTNGVNEDAGTEFLVDRADVGTAIAGRSFLYNTNDGSFDLYSTNGIGGAFLAVTADDEGSPGVPPSSGAIVLLQQPADLSVTVGDTVELTAVGIGLPKPKFQWLFNGNPVNANAVNISFNITNNQVESILTITNVQGANGGAYSFLATNGIESVTSSNAVLTVNAAPTAPVFTQIPASLSAYFGQTVTFAATASGNPSPAFQWQFNNTNLDGQTASQLQIAISGTNQSGTYTLIATNSIGSTNVSVTLTVTPMPNLVITEVMPSESSDNSNGDTSGHQDWFELSNLGNFPVSLFGYRIDDSHASLAQSATVTNQTMIQPGESVVFVQDMTPDEFRAWWGTNLSPALQIIDYDGSGQGLSASGDEVHVWNAAATDDSDQVASAAFETASAGISFGFDPNPNDANYGFLGFAPDGLSVSGVNGAFVAAVGGDIGSPGAVVNMPSFTGVASTNGGFQLSWFSQPNWTNVVQFKNSLSETNWTTLTNLNSGGTNLMNFVDPTTSTQRFYRVILNLNQ